MLSDLDQDSGSDLSSPATRSPSPPSSITMARSYGKFHLPSPPPTTQQSSTSSTQQSSTSSTQHTSKSSPAPYAVSTCASSEENGLPPAKRRRVASTMPRTTEHVELDKYLGLPTVQTDADKELKRQVDTLLKAIRKKRKIVVIAGAGISVSAGIPDFRSSTGMFKTLRSEDKLKPSGKQLFDAAVYRDAPSTTSFHDMIRSLHKDSTSAKPTPFHHLLATLAYEGRLLRLYTQNVDCIDTSLAPLETQIPLPPKGPWRKTVQLHGGIKNMVCTKCNSLFMLKPELFHGPIPPECESCKSMDHVRTQIAGKRSHGIGKLRPRMVLYHEDHPDAYAIGAISEHDLRARPDAVLVVGTSLQVPGVRRLVREMCATVRDRKDGLAVWINTDGLPSGKEFAECFDLVVEGTSDSVAELAGLRRWDDDEIGGDNKEVSQEMVDSVRARGVPAVIVDVPAVEYIRPSSPEDPFSKQPKAPRKRPYRGSAPAFADFKVIKGVNSPHISKEIE